MACQIQTEKYTSVVLNLLSLDPNKYNNFDNAAALVLSSNLTPEQKMLSVHNIAHIYNDLATLDDKNYFEKGKVQDILSATALTETPEKYVEFASNLMGVKSPSKLRLETLQKKIDALGNKKTITLRELQAPEGILSVLSNYFSVTQFESLEDREALLGELAASIKERINDFQESEAVKELLSAQVDATANSLRKNSEYISLSAIADTAQLNNVLVTLANGQKVEAIRQDGKFFRIMPDQSLQAIEESDVASAIDTRLVDTSVSNAGEQVFFEDTLLSSFTIKALNPEENFVVQRKLESMSSPMSGIRITAVKNSDIATQKLERIQNAASGEYALRALQNRKHYTYENDAQQKFLQSTPNGKVLTVSMPTREQQNWVMVGEIIGTGEKFYIYPVDNYVFVNSDNTTEQVNFSNLAHLNEVKTLSKKKTFLGLSDMTDGDVQALAAASEKWKAFQEKLGDMPEGAESMDITDEFFANYEINSRREKPKRVSLAEQVQNDPAVSQRVTVVTLAGKEVVSSEERLVPFYFTRYSASAPFKLISFLKSNEYIQVTNAKGESVNISQARYAEQVLGLDSDEKIKALLTQNDQKQRNILLRWNKDGSIAYKPIDPVILLDNAAEFATFLVGLSDVLTNSTNRKADIKAFDKNQYTFETQSSNNPSERSNAPLYVNFSTDAKGRLQIEIRPKDPSGKYAFIKDKSNSGLFNFPLNEQKIVDYASAFQGSLGDKVKIVQAAIPALQELDLKNKEDLYKFYSMVAEMSADKTPLPEVSDLVTAIIQAQTKFANFLINSVIKNIESKTASVPEFMENLKKDFTYNGVFRPEFLLVDENRETGTLIPKISYSPNYQPKNGMDAKERSRTNLANYKVLNQGQKRFSIVPKTAAPSVAIASTVKTVAPVEEQAPKAVAQNLKTDPSDDIETLEIVYSIADGAVETETEEERLQQAEWLSQNLPQFGLDRENLSDIIALAKIDGTVLGAFKDRVIYLNEAIKSKGVIYHEAFHGVFRHLMSAELRDQLIDAVTKNKTHASKFTEASLKEFARQRGMLYNREEAKRLQAEEILADGFQNHMNSKKAAPKTLLGKFMEMLKKLLNFFKANKDLIESVYGDINSGRYSTAIVQTGLYDGKVAYELIPGIPRIINGPTGKAAAAMSLLGVEEQNQLVNLVTYYLLKDNNTREKFDERFDRITKLILDTEYNMDRLVSQNPEKKDQIIAQYGDLIKNYRFMLGDRFRGGALYDINETGNDAYNEKTTATKVKNVGTGEVQDNVDGKVSYETLKKLVKQRLDSVSSIIEGNPARSVNKEELDKALNGEEIFDENAELKDETPEQDYDASFNEHNRLESQSRQIREFLALVRYDQEVEELSGSKDKPFKFPRMINGNEVYSQLLKISSDLEPENIVDNIRIQAKNLLEDGYRNAGMDLQAVYNSLADSVMFDAQGNPQRNMQLYNMLVDVLHGTEADYVMFNVDSAVETIDPQSNETSFATRGFTIKDKIMFEDVNKKKKDIISSIITTRAKNTSLDDYKAYQQKVAKLLELTKTITSDTHILSDINSQEARLTTLTEQMHSALKDVGITVPKSLVRMSILAIDEVENLKDADIQGDIRAHYQAHEKFVQEKKYLERDWFKDLENIMTRAIASDMTQNKFAQMLDDKNTKDESINRFNAILGKAATYIVKYDPTELPSTTRNAEGKPIYRYVKYTPAFTVAQQLRGKGLIETMSQDPYFKSQLENFLTDNGMLGDIMKRQDTKRSRAVQLFLDNFNMQLFGGVAQSVNNTFKQGSSFKDIDDRSMDLLNLMTFMNRTTYSKTQEVIAEDGTKSTETTKIETYMRSFSQLEASQTNFLMSAVYIKYAGKNGSPKDGLIYEDGRLKFVKDLQNVVRQEYNRIQREWQKSNTNKDAFDNREANNLILKYNGKLDKNDPSKAITNSADLRAYQFNMLPDFFKANPEVNTLLIKAAKENISFENIEAGLNEDLLNSLEEYAKDAFEVHLDKLTKLGAIRKTTLLRRNAEGEVIVDADPLDEYYTSEYLATTLRKDGIKVGDALDNYMPAKDGSKNLKGLIADAFFNHWANSLYFNQLLDGDMAMNVKDPVDYFKRNKKFLAAGSTLKSGTHKVSYLNTISAFISNQMPTKGPYYSKAEITADDTLTEDQKQSLLEEFGSDGTMYDMFDGQSITSLMHQMDMHMSLGRLKPELERIMIAKHYRDLTEAEVRALENNKIVNNPKKTVTAARNSYHKLSENYIDRNDVSVLVRPIDPATGRPVSIDQVYERLQGLYTDIYSARQEIQAIKKVGQTAGIKDLQDDIRRKYEEIHSFYQPMPHREILHNLLNSMEYHQVDQLIDTTASKNATVLPVDYFVEAEKAGPDGYIDLDFSSLEVENKYKYLQVETSGVKDKAKFSVQSKALIAADLVNLAEIAEKSGREITPTERIAMTKVADTLVAYQETLREIGESNLANLKTILRKDGDFELGKVFTMIRESLIEQGASDNDIKLFEVDSSGQPIHSANLPGIRGMLDYYFFSQYSKHVTDEKGSGFKSIHISSVGYNILTDENGNNLTDEEGNIVTSEMYRRNPEKYPNVKFRAPGISKQVNEDGTTTYFVEAIVPKPFFRNKAHEKLYMKQLNKMFGVRIPTEDKRSMIALKVVDFMDSSNLNGIVVPHFIHMLAGSDFDVDSLYGQTYATYFNMAGQPAIYGNYDMYDSVEKGKFVEFISYMMKDPDMEPLIKARKKKLSSENEYAPSQDTLDFLYAQGFDESDFQGAMNFSELLSEYDLLNADIQELVDIKNEAKEEYVESIQKTEIDPTDREAWKLRGELGAEVAEYNQELKEKRAQRNEYGKKMSRAKSFTFAALKAEAALQVLAEYGLPVTLTAFNANPAYAKAVRPAFQNANLTAKLGILSNEAVFNHLYINERSSTQRFKDIYKTFRGKDIKEHTSPYNHYTVDGVIAAKSANSTSKDGIGITANQNKFLALASQYGLQLKPEEVIWQFNTVQDNTVTQKSYTKFGALNEEGKRTIELIGNILGMFADGAKDPIPDALNMTAVNSGVTLSMIGIGLTPEFALGMNFLPGVKNAIADVQATQFAISEAVSKNAMFFTEALRMQMQKIDKENKVLDSLKEKKVIDEKSSLRKINFSDNLVINFEPKVLNEVRLDNNMLTPSDIGYDVRVIVDKATGATEKLTDAEAAMVLLSMYQKQAQQSWAIQRAGSILNLFKKLNPNFVAFDKLMNNIQELSEGSIFTKQSVDKIFADNQIWPVMLEALKDLDEQSSKIFLERSNFFRPLKNAFGPLFNDPKSVAQIITSYVALQKYQESFPGSRKSSVEAAQAIIDRDDANLRKAFTAEYWFTNDLDEELKAMQEKYPNNKFLQMLRTEKSDNKAYTTTGEILPEKSIRIIGQGKLSADFLRNVNDDAYKLMAYENLFMKKLFYHELVKTGLQPKKGSFLRNMSPDMQIPLSSYIKEFSDIISGSEGNRKELMKGFSEYLNAGANEPQVYEFFKELFRQMAYAGVNDVKGGNVRRAYAVDFKTSRAATSLTLDATATETDRQRIMTDLMTKVTGIAPSGRGLKYSYQSRTADGKAIRGQLVFDLSVPADIKEVNREVMDALSYTLGATPFNDGNYAWPMLLMVDGQYYYLSDVAHVQGAKWNIVDKMVETGDFDTVGFKARYTALPKTLSSGTISPLAYTTTEAKKYMDYVNGKQRIEAKATPVQAPAAPAQNKPGTINIYAGTGENAELSNFATRPFTFKGQKFSSVEQAFQYAKGEFYNTYAIDPSSSEKPSDIQAKVDAHLKAILNAKTGAAIKALGRKDIGVDFEKQMWDDASSAIMKNLIAESFKQNPEARAKLLATGNATLTHTQDKGKWGKEFPKLLMEVRQELSNPAPAAVVTEADGAQDGSDILRALMGGTESQFDTDLQNLNLTPEVLRYLYEQGSKRMDKRAFAQAAADMVANMRATKTNEEIIEKIKCL